MACVFCEKWVDLAYSGIMDVGEFMHYRLKYLRIFFPSLYDNILDMLQKRGIEEIHYKRVNMRDL